MINLISYVLAFIAIVAIISVLVVMIHYLIFGLSWLVDHIFDPFLFK